MYVMQEYRRYIIISTIYLSSSHHRSRRDQDERSGWRELPQIEELSDKDNLLGIEAPQQTISIRSLGRKSLPRLKKTMEAKTVNDDQWHAGPSIRSAFFFAFFRNPSRYSDLHGELSDPRLRIERHLRQGARCRNIKTGRSTETKLTQIARASCTPRFRKQVAAGQLSIKLLEKCLDA
jgi:hypothetical protein